MPSEIVMRHRLPHFQHVFTGGSYAAGYYSYMWSEVLDADAFAAFEEVATSSIRRPQKSCTITCMQPAESAIRELYVAFPGRLPTPDGLLRRRGLLDAVTPE
jgi:peptidyl-dipeptidase Dcp